MGVTGMRSVVSAATAAASPDAMGGLDILVDNAGTLRIARPEALSQEAWDQVMESNVGGAFPGLEGGRRGQGHRHRIDVHDLRRRERRRLGRRDGPEDLAGTDVFLASMASDYVACRDVASITVDGGFSIRD